MSHLYHHTRYVLCQPGRGANITRTYNVLCYQVNVRWYRNAAQCYVFYLMFLALRPILVTQESQSPCQCRWFTRGWTLQELLALPAVYFFSQDRDELGTKLSLLSVLRLARAEEASLIPAWLDALYNRMMQQMSESDNAKICSSILASTTILYRPVTVSEVVALDEQLEDVSDDVREIVSLCRSFLALQEDTVYFVH